MPFETGRTIPREVKALPAGARKIWTAAFTRALRETPEDLATDLAMRAVEQHYTQENGVWRESSATAGSNEPGTDSETDPPNEPEGDPAMTAETEAVAAEEKATVARARAKFRGKRKDTKDSQSEYTTDSVELTETLTLDSKGFRLTSDGFLVAEPRVARTGIQIYSGQEVGRPEMDRVRVYRPEDQVFDKRAMASLAHRPITLEHPDTVVTSSNWKSLAVGHSSEPIVRDREFIRVPLVLMDAHAIAAVQSGTSQLSVGYGAKLQWGPGQAPDGQLYDALQTEIRANHIALVSTARGGDKLTIGDVDKPQDRGLSKRRQATQDDRNTRSLNMGERSFNLDGVSIELSDKDGQILDRHLAGLNRKLTKKFADQDTEVDVLKQRNTELETQLAEIKKASGTKDGEIAALSAKIEDGKLTPDKLDAALNRRMDVVDRATTFFGDASKYAWQGKADSQIRRDVVTARLGDAKTKVMNDDAIEGAFLSLTETEPQDGFQRMTQSFSRAPANYSDRAASAYDKRNEELANRFKRNKKPFGASA